MDLVVALLQLAAICYVALPFALGVVDWLLRPRDLVMRRHELFHADPGAAIRRKVVRTALFSFAMLVGWQWADLRWLWLALAFAYLLAGSGAGAAGARAAANPDASRELTEDAISRIVARERFLRVVIPTLFLIAWLASWRGVVRAWAD